MFVELAGMMKKEGDIINITVVSLADGQMSLMVTPKVPDTAHEALKRQMHLQGTPAELDAEIAQLLAGYVGSRQSLQDQLAAQKAVLDQAGAKVAATTAQAINKGNGAKPGKATVSTVQAALTTTPQPAGDDAEEELDEDGDGDTAAGAVRQQTAPAAAPATAPAAGATGEAADLNFQLF